LLINPAQRSVLEALRQGPLDHYQLAAELAEAPWLIRETLRGLRASQLVTAEIRPRNVTWRLTDRGYGLIWGGDQLSLEAIS
jgi:DNA-binding HxlR family transcriptional regulator